MSDEARYDHPLRLLEVSDIAIGIGKTAEASREDKAARKRALVPRVSMIPPEGVTPEDADAEIVRLLEEIFVCCARIRGVIECSPPEFWPDKFRDAMLMHLYALLSEADVPWQALARNPARMTMAGYLSRLLRQGKEVTGVGFGKGE